MIGEEVSFTQRSRAAQLNTWSLYYEVKKFFYEYVEQKRKEKTPGKGKEQEEEGPRPGKSIRKKKGK